jgi:hypothetical protein
MTEKRKHKELTRKQEAALILLVDGGANLSLDQIAARISVAPRTLHRWRTENELFIGQYRQMRRAVVEAGLSRIQGLVGKAIDTLEANLSSGNRPSECRAASTIINKAIEAVEVADFDERLKAIEKRFEG